MEWAPQKSIYENDSDNGEKEMRETGGRENNSNSSSNNVINNNRSPIMFGNGITNSK